jgi:hypothetical protein
LYRAATKTFHSTQVLRHLFHVHAYLAEFELAIKALDSYHSIVIHGKARLEKSGEMDYSLDGNDRILSISSEAIIILCRFGQRKEAEKAREIASKVSAWVEEFDVQPAIPESAGTNGVTTQPPQQFAAPSTVALAHHALGTSEAHWSRLSHVAASRTAHQTKALEHFRIAVHRRFGQSKNLDFLFSLAVLMAEMRDIQGSMRVVKQAVAEGAQKAYACDADNHIPERKLVRFWHLLTLLLSTRSDLVSAAKASNAAFEQFKEPSVVFGHQEFRSEHLNETTPTPESQGLVDRMSSFEKEGILQVRITQVALLEALEGSMAAVDATADLLALYARLFGGMKDREVSKPLSTTVKVPKSAVGSLRASIFKRARSRKGEREEATSRATTARPSTVATTAAAPTIQVTDESSSETPRGRRVNGSRGQSTPMQTRSRGDDGNTGNRSSSQHKLHKKSARNSMESFQAPSPVVPYDEKPEDNAIPADNGVRVSVQSSRRPSVALSATTGASFVTAADLDSAAEQSPPRLLSPHRSLPSIHSTYSYRPAVAVSLESNPAPTFSSLADQRHTTTLLVELWLFVSGLYTRSGLYDDAQAAIDEAVELVKRLEMYVARQTSSAKAFSTRGWGGGRSIDELWGDVWSQVKPCIVPRLTTLCL